MKQVSTNFQEFLTSATFSDHNAVKSEINNKKHRKRTPYVWEIGNILLYNSWVKKKP